MQREKHKLQLETLSGGSLPYLVSIIGVNIPQILCEPGQMHCRVFSSLIIIYN